MHELLLLYIPFGPQVEPRDVSGLALQAALVAVSSSRTQFYLDLVTATEQGLCDRAGVSDRDRSKLVGTGSFPCMVNKKRSLKAPSQRCLMPPWLLSGLASDGLSPLVLPRVG